MAFRFSRKKLGSLDPTTTDVDSAVVWMITRDLRVQLPKLFEDVKAWLKVLHTVRKRKIIFNPKKIIV